MVQLTERQKDVLIRTALGEARGEGVEGMADVIQVILNRANSGRFPSDPAAVAQQPYQFSTWNKGEGGNNPQQFRKSDPIYKKAEQALNAVVSGSRPDYTGGALFYHTPSVNPNWSREANRFGTINRNGHIFYPSRPVPPGDIPNVVASQLDVTPRRVEPSMPTPMPPMLAAQRNLQPVNTNTQAVYNGIFPQRELTQAGEINRSVQSAQSGQNPALAAALQSRIQAQSAPKLPVSYAGQDRGAPYQAPVPAKLPPILPSTQSYAGQERGGRTVTPVKPAPKPVPQSVIERNVAPAVIPNSVVTQSVQAAQAATNPQLAAALARSTIPSGTPINTRSRDSVGQAAMGSAFSMPSAIPGPASAPKSQDRLTAGIYPAAPVQPAAPVPPISVAASVPLPRTRPAIAPRSQPVTGFPTPVAQRPMMQPQRTLAGLAMPRPLPQMAQSQPLQVVVQGGNYINPANHSAAQLQAISQGKSSFKDENNSYQPVYAMNGKIRNTY